jgi:hypothetical protein
MHGKILFFRAFFKIFGKALRGNFGLVRALCTRVRKAHNTLKK